jgi:arylsulfatase A-like enzyme
LQPNILWICTDQQRYDTIGALGYDHVSTPHIDSLVETGTTFTRAYCQSPICSPSRASFLTGMYASAVHVNGNGLESFPDRPKLVTKLFAEAGYDCGLIGKLHLASASQGIEPRAEDGYRYWEYSHAPRQYRDIFDPAAMPGALFRDRDVEEQERLSFADFQSQVRRPEELDIDNRYYLAAKDAPYKPSDVRLLQAAYCAMIKQIDDQLGRILAALDESGLRDDTIIVFTSDHGEMLGDHGLIQKGCRFYEGLVRVPLIFSWPGHIRAGVKSDALVELSDKAPTLLELSGAPVPESMTGRSLAPILRGTVSPQYHRDFVRCEYYDALLAPDGTFATMYRDERYKLVVYHGRQYGELYDLQEDPGEFENLWENPALAVKRAELMKCSFDASMLAMDRGPRRIGGI